MIFFGLASLSSQLLCHLKSAVEGTDQKIESHLVPVPVAKDGTGSAALQGLVLFGSSLHVVQHRQGQSVV